jgi:hypothetical protein
MNLRTIARTASLTVGLSFLASTPAWAVDCDQIMGMLGAGVPASIVVQTMQNSGANYKPEEIQCLAEKGAPAEVLTAARDLKADTEPVPTNPANTPPAGGKTDELKGAKNNIGAVGEEGDDLPEEGEGGEGSGNDPRVLQEVIELYRAKKFLSSSKALFDMLEKDEFPEQKSKIFYYMAKSLDDLGMYHGAQHYYMQVVRKGPEDPYFKYALPKLVQIAEYTGNDLELLRIVHKIAPEAYPRQASNHLFYLMGRREYEKEELARAQKYFQQISAKSNLYMRSKYYEGVINHQRNKYKSAVAAFRELYQADVPASDARESKEYANLKDLALINIARIYYELEKYENADEYYKQVDRESDFWAQSLFERAWTKFILTDLNNTLGLLLTLKAPYYQQLEYNPEGDILRALTFFYLCDYEAAQRILLQFEDKYKPMREELKAFLAEYNTDEGRKLADSAYDAYFIKGNADSKLNKQMLYRVLQNRDISTIVEHMDMMDREIAMVDEQKGVWKDTVGAHLKKVIEEDRVRYKQRAGLALIQELDRQNKKLGSWMSQSQIIRFEIVDAQRKVLEKRATDVLIDNLDAGTTDFAVSREIIYWPFNGEFWDDELGYYQYTEKSSCQ